MLAAEADAIGALAVKLDQFIILNYEVRMATAACSALAMATAAPK